MTCPLEAIARFVFSVASSLTAHAGRVYSPLKRYVGCLTGLFFAKDDGIINLELAALKRMYNLTLQEATIKKKPHIPGLEENSASQGFFEKHEFESVLSKLPEPLRTPFTFAYYFGWRPRSEVFPVR